MPFLGTTGGGSVKQYGGQANLGYFIKNSLRFRSSASGYLSRTPASATNRKTWTWSAWIKRGTLGASTGLFQASPVVSNQTSFTISSSNTIILQDYSAASSYNLVWESSAVFRDPSAWYHIVGVFDVTQASSANAVKLYVNGVQQTLVFTAYTGAYVQNRDGYINSNIAHNIGLYSASEYFDGYLGEINFVDGQALTPSSFGKTDAATGQWIPKKFAGTYGTNGFYLKFADTSGITAATIGKDSSGNGNNFTPSGISNTDGVTYDFMIDSPTLSGAASNYATLNPLHITDNGGNIATFSNGNLKASFSNTNYFSCYVTIQSDTWQAGDYGAEFYVDAIGAYNYGVTLCFNGTTVRTDGTNGGGITGTYTFTTGDYIQVKSTAAGTITWYKNGTQIATGSVSAMNTSGRTGPQLQGIGAAASMNCGQQPWKYSAPLANVKTLNTYNLP